MPKDKPNYETMNHQARRSRLESTKRTKQLDRIYQRDRGICQICFLPCKRSEASREHLKEFSQCTKEEARDLNNMILAHIVCNGRRHHPNSYGKAYHMSKKFDPRDHLLYKIGEIYPELSSLLPSRIESVI